MNNSIVYLITHKPWLPLEWLLPRLNLVIDFFNIAFDRQGSRRSLSAVVLLLPYAQGQYYFHFRKARVTSAVPNQSAPHYQKALTARISFCMVPSP